MLLYIQMLETPEEKSKFEQLYLGYRNLMFYVANRILHNQQDSEDVVHDSFLKIIKIIKKIENPKCPQTRSLIVIITERTAIDLYRRHQKITESPLDEEQLCLPSSVEIETAEKKTDLALAVATLPPKYRAVLLLRYDHGFSETEVAQILSMSVDNVHKTIQRAKKKLDMLGMGNRLQHKPNELSGGQQQRVAIARALVGEPKLLLADEPTGALDSNTGKEVLKLFRELNDMGHTIVMITHDLNVATHARRVVRIIDGALYEGDCAEAGPLPVAPSAN